MGVGWKGSLPMISAQIIRKVVASPFWGLGLLPLGMISSLFPYLLVKVGKKECPISNEMQAGRQIFDCFIESSDK